MWQLLELCVAIVNIPLEHVLLLLPLPDFRLSTNKQHSPCLTSHASCSSCSHPYLPSSSPNRTLQSQDVVCITWATARLGHYCPQLFSRLMWRAVVVRGALYPQGVAMMLAGCARAGHNPDPRAVAQLLQVGTWVW